MSLYGDYIKEKLNKEIVETSEGFATYCYLAGKIVYVEDVYVIPERRKQSVGSSFIDHISAIAREKGMTKVLVTVNVKANNPAESMKPILNYGFRLAHSNENFLTFEKEL